VLGAKAVGHSGSVDAFEPTRSTALVLRDKVVANRVAAQPIRLPAEIESLERQARRANVTLLAWREGSRTVNSDSMCVERGVIRRAGRDPSSGA
jgi:hypothetical protein